tara:strand:+ start:132 stop:551 length:420 start_codon:yes stop_codon:yes gene_type:complete
MIIDNSKAIADGLKLFINSNSYSRYRLEDINTYLILPIYNNRIRIFYQEEKPIGLITWCWLTKEKANKFLQYKYDPVEEDYKDTEINNKQLWCLDFISTKGKAKQMITSVRKEHAKLYGKNKVHWRRFSNPTKEHKKEF